MGTYSLRCQQASSLAGLASSCPCFCSSLPIEAPTCPKRRCPGNWGSYMIGAPGSCFAWCAVCNPVFWERDLRWHKSTWYAAFWEQSWEGLWQMHAHAIKNRNSTTSERQLRDQPFLKAQYTGPVPSTLHALCSLKKCFQTDYVKNLEACQYIFWVLKTYVLLFMYKL